MIALNFHGIGTPHDGVDEHERAYWFSHDQFADLLARIWREHDPAQFAFTFDDGNKSDLAAAEMLAGRGATARFFLLTGRMGDGAYCAPEDARALVKMGMVVGLHGRNHVDWRKCDHAALLDETQAARAELAAVLGEPVDEVAIPFGAYDSRVISALRQQGFARIHTSDGGRCQPSARIWNRNSLHQNLSQAELSAILHGRFSPLRRLRAGASQMLRRYVS